MEIVTQFEWADAIRENSICCVEVFGSHGNIYIPKMNEQNTECEMTHPYEIIISQNSLLMQMNWSFKSMFWSYVPSYNHMDMYNISNTHVYIAIYFGMSLLCLSQK